MSQFTESDTPRIDRIMREALAKEMALLVIQNERYRIALQHIARFTEDMNDVCDCPQHGAVRIARDVLSMYEMKP